MHKISFPISDQVPLQSLWGHLLLQIKVAWWQSDNTTCSLHTFPLHENYLALTTALMDFLRRWANVPYLKLPVFRLSPYLSGNPLSYIYIYSSLSFFNFTHVSNDLRLILWAADITLVRTRPVLCIVMSVLCNLTWGNSFHCYGWHI